MSPQPFPHPEPLPDELADTLARVGDRLGIFRGEILWFTDVSSTNDLAAAMASHGAREGRVVFANAQSAGRGRHGRSWASPPGAGLYVSVILRPPAHALSLLTLAAGVAISEGIESATGLRTDLKWPNDVYSQGRKLAGVLAEASTADGAGVIQHVIVGAGINVLTAAYPAAVASRATSLEAELGREADRGLLLAEYLASLASRYDDLRADRGAAVARAWRTRAAAMLGRRVRVEGEQAIREGVAVDIDEGGALLVRTGGSVVRVTAGEVAWI